MPRVRNIYQNKALYVGDTGVTANPSQLNRIQSINFDYDLAGLRSDVYEMGRLAPISRPISNTNLTVKLKFDYLLTDGKNESLIGLTLSNTGNPSFVSCVSGILSNNAATAINNYYVLTVPEGSDAVQTSAYTAGQAANHYVAGIGNGFLSSYSVSAEVGGTPKATVNIEGANLVFYTGSSGIANPAINSDTMTRLGGTTSIPTATTGSSRIDILLPGDVEITWGSDLQFGGADLTSMHPQSVSIELPLARTPIQRLGSKGPFSRQLTVPITTTMSVSAILADLDPGSLNTLLTGCTSESARDITVQINNRCNPNNSALTYTMKGVVLDNQSFGVNLQGEETVDLSFSAIVAGPQDLLNGLGISGSF